MFVHIQETGLGQTMMIRKARHLRVIKYEDTTTYAFACHFIDT